MDVRLRRRGRADRVHDHHLAARFRQPAFVRVRCRCMRIRAPDDDALRMIRRAGIESVHRRAVQVPEGDVPRHVANRVGRHLGGPEAVKKTHRRNPGEQGNGSGVVCVENRLCAVRCNDAAQPLRDLRARAVPGYGFEPPRAFRADAPQRQGQAPLRVAPLAVVGSGALSAESTATDGVSRIAAHRRDHPVTPMHQHSAGVVAIARACRENHILARLAGRHGEADSCALLSNSARICEASSRSGVPRNLPISAAV